MAGGRLVVRPSWEAAAARGTEIDIVVDPGRAFGTGAHATTRACLELLLELAGAGEARGELADWGTGSGVLAIAAAKLGWAPVARVRPRGRLDRGGRRQREDERRRDRDRAGEPA